jgi:hypothetical protein
MANATPERRGMNLKRIILGLVAKPSGQMLKPKLMLALGREAR